MHPNRSSCRRGERRGRSNRSSTLISGRSRVNRLGGRAEIGANVTSRCQQASEDRRFFRPPAPRPTIRAQAQPPRSHGYALHPARLALLALSRASSAGCESERACARRSHRWRNAGRRLLHALCAHTNKGRAAPQAPQLTPSLSPTFSSFSLNAGSKLAAQRPLSR